MTDQWDGRTERRAAVVAEVSSRAHEMVQVPIVVLIVGFTAVALFQLGAILQHIVLLQDHNTEERFRNQISCFVIGSAQGKAGTDLLTSCDFLRLGG